MENLLIEPLRRSDLPFLNEVRNSCANFLHDDKQFSLEETIDWFINLSKNQKYYLISLPNTDKSTPIGYIRTKSKRCTRASLDNGSLEVGMDLHEYYRGKGYAKQAYLQFIESNKHEYIDFELEVLGDNTRAYNLYRSLGFRPLGCVTDVIRSNGTLIPSIKMVRNNSVLLYEF